jgi:hypothetical protein
VSGEELPLEVVVELPLEVEGDRKVPIYRGHLRIFGHGFVAFARHPPGNTDHYLHGIFLRRRKKMTTPTGLNRGVEAASFGNP